MKEGALPPCGERTRWRARFRLADTGTEPRGPRKRRALRAVPVRRAAWLARSLGLPGALALPAHRATAARAGASPRGVARQLRPPGPIETIEGHRDATPGRVISEEWAATAVPGGSLDVQRASAPRHA